MKTRHLYLVDVFAERAWTGNPLAVVVSADFPPSETMQQIAAEMNFSETTFVRSAPAADGGYRMRIFTPAREIEFAGHPILGSAWVIRRHLPGVGPTVWLDLAVGRIPVGFESVADNGEIAWFRAPRMMLGPTCAAETIAPALGLRTSDIDTQAPVQKVSAGTSAVIVPLRSLDALRRARLDLAAYAPLVAAGFPPLTYLFCRETHQPGNDLCARFFFEAHGVREDPATGNGAAFLGAWLLEHRFFARTDLSLRIEQGHELQRPSLIRLRARMAEGVHAVEVGGGVVATVEGRLL